ncbi:hypothetical protein [Streptomyces clavuligerus]|uniref:Uncharacterized protein n=1 Tax=Streptomyces clavuligerus TaxID=1901 RepID=E2PUP1_STRCL|nr:hypothetical protein [Streptomyces clavuligerus]ANW19394.1 hypothetical protein BB341_14780 [Streptomyces clavuligerus]AXU14000.1 hypothetical protein D1794_15420 [Streptomyces clavuligerus]EFG07820.1 Hypothetical protein SCLAV_2748 [Streptomyces clavuligerus]MBY6303974.1 hypothetical protein [Streptomyces clavuligerus]QCS06773.1 hypothetical protein CRV15_14775 [Streptomyces clavuligerus]
MSGTETAEAPDGGAAPDRDDPNTLVRRDAVLIVAVLLDRTPAEPFRPGPLERVWRAGRHDEVVSHAERRAAYTDAGLTPLLWSPEVRWHRETTGPVVSPFGFRLDAVELIRLTGSARQTLAAMGTPPVANGVALLHGTLPPHAPVRMAKTLQECADVNAHRPHPAQRMWVADQLPPGCRIADFERKAVHCTLMTPRGALPPPYEADLPEWELLDQWLWSMQHATQYPPSDEAREQLDGIRFPLPHCVRAALGSRGLTLIGADPEPARNYYTGAAYHLTTLYADALALARLQQIVLDAFGAEVARVAEREPGRRPVALLERELLVFRRSYWSAGFGRQENVDEMTRAWQRAAGLPDALQRLTGDLGELSRQVQAAETATTNAILGLIAAFGLPLTAGLAVWAGLPSAGTTSLWRFLGVIAVATAALVVFFPGLRRLLVDLFRRRRPGTAARADGRRWRRWLRRS